MLIASIRTACLIMLVVILTGCFGGRGTAARTVEQYQLSYAAPSPSLSAPLAASITVERFSASQAYTRLSMVFKPDEFRVDEYQYHRWRLAPADMATELLRRDLQSSGIFQAVFGSADLQRSKYRLAGRVEEFHEADHQGRQAVLAVQVTLYDTEQKQQQHQILFQRIYRQSVKLVALSPDGLVKAMSQAMEQVSRQLQQEIATTIAAKKGK